MEEHDYDGPPDDEDMNAYPNNVSRYYWGNLNYEGLGYLAELPTEVLLLIGSFVVVDENVFYKICCTSKAFAQWFFVTVDSFTVKITKNYRADSLFRLLPFLARKYKRMCITTESAGILPDLPSNLTSFECDTLSYPYERCLRLCKSLTDLTVIKYYHSFIETLAHLKNLTNLYLYGFDAWYYDITFLENLANLNVKTFKTVVPAYVKPNFVSNMTSVQELQLYSIDVPDLVKLTNLEKLYQFRIDEKIFTLTQLTSLSVGSPKFILSKQSLWDQLEVFSRLKELSVTCKKKFPLPLKTTIFPTLLQSLSITNARTIDVNELLQCLKPCKNLKWVELEAEISISSYEELEQELNLRGVEFVRADTQHRFIVAIDSENSSDKYDFDYKEGDKGYLIEDHGSKYLVYKARQTGFVDSSKWKLMPEDNTKPKDTLSDPLHLKNTL